MFDAIISFFEPIFTWFQGFIDALVYVYRITAGALSAAWEYFDDVVQSLAWLPGEATFLVSFILLFGIVFFIIRLVFGKG